ncbi:MAG TPA: hypothetical protein HPP77_04980 [Candidatus Hydrogenedentes bacterium]|nr:hypothetical protein [Candidatus Hydrogenedentota bacterium]
MSEKRTIWYWAALAALVAALLAYAQHRDLYGRYLEYRASQQHLGALQDERATRQRKVVELAEKIAGLESDQLEKEAAMRRNEKLVREGETVFRFEAAPAQVP